VKEGHEYIKLSYSPLRAKHKASMTVVIERKIWFKVVQDLQGQAYLVTEGVEEATGMVLPSAV
jgi:hypothetical protein